MSADHPTILQIIPELDTGGAELSTIEISEAVVRAGGRALVLSEGGRLASRVADVGGEFVPFPAASKNPLRMALNVRAIAAIARSEAVDLIHARSRAPAWSALAAARLTGARFVTTYHGIYKENNAVKRAYNSVMARGDTVIANSDYTAKVVKSRYHVDAQRIVTILRGADHQSAFNPGSVSSDKIAALRTAWNVDPHCRIILLPGRLTPIKGHVVAIEAARLLKDRGSLGNAVFVLVGGNQGRDAYTDMLASEIDRHGLQDRFRFAGHSDSMPVCFAAAHVTLAISTVPEGFGRVSAESQAMCCPVIVSDLGALPETIVVAPSSAATGWTAPAGDAAALATAIERSLALNEADRHAMGQRARIHCTNSFTTTTLQSQTLAVYDRLLGTHLQKSFQDARSG